MSFRLFVYYCAICGGWAAFLGWLLGALFAPGSPADPDLVRNATIGMFLGMMIAMGLGFLDALWVLSFQRLGELTIRVLVAVLIGAIGGFLGGMTAHLLYDLSQSEILAIIGWLFVGVLCGASIGSFDFLSSLTTGKDKKGAKSKFLKCLIGGTLGGGIGAALFLLFRAILPSVFGGRTTLSSPTALGFVAIGVCTGLLVGLAQVILKEAWIKVESGFRAGREMILAKERTSLGRAEGSDIALFGDAGVEKLHAHIVQSNGRYLLEDNGAPGGTFVNDQKVNGSTALQSGDMIRLGKSVLRFYEKPKKR